MVTVVGSAFPPLLVTLIGEWLAREQGVSAPCTIRVISTRKGGVLRGLAYTGRNHIAVAASRHPHAPNAAYAGKWDCSRPLRSGVEGMVFALAHEMWHLGYGRAHRRARGRERMAQDAAQASLDRWRGGVRFRLLCEYRRALRSKAKSKRSSTTRGYSQSSHPQSRSFTRSSTRRTTPPRLAEPFGPLLGGRPALVSLFALVKQNW